MNVAGVEPKVALRSILFATDFDVSSGRALPFAVALRDRYDAKLVVAHVVPEEAYIYARPESLPHIQRETDSYAREELSRLVIALKHGGGSCEPVLSMGNVPLVLVHLLKQYSIDLAVIGSGSRGGLNKVLLGSVAEELIREAPCPVVTIGPHVTTEAAEGLRAILCAVDFSTESLQAAEFALSLAEEYGAHLTLLHVMQEDREEGVASVRRHAEQLLRGLIPMGADLLFAPRLAVEEGRPGECILRVAYDLSADAIAMGVRGAGAFAHAASHFGSIAHYVLSLAKCPVLTAGAISTLQEDRKTKELENGSTLHCS